MGKCYETNHDYRPTSAPYFKRDGKTTAINIPSYDQSIEFQMLYCTKCGDTKEIIAADHRQKSEA